MATTTRTPRPTTVRGPGSATRFLVGFAVYFGVIWTFWESRAIYPLKIFVVLLHELSHALATVATGGVVDRITLDAMQGGATYSLGGSSFVILSAGYLGSLLFGVLLLVAGLELRKGLRPALAGVALGVLASTVLLVRSGFGLVYGVVAGLTLLGLARFLPAIASRIVLTTLGLTSCLYAILDIKSDVIDRPGAPSDAFMLSELTGVPTLVWGGLWIGLAFLVSALVLRWAYRRAAARA